MAYHFLLPWCSYTPHRPLSCPGIQASRCMPYPWCRRKSLRLWLDRRIVSTFTVSQLSSRCTGSLTSQGGYVFKSDTLPSEGAGVGATMTGAEGKFAVYVVKNTATELLTAAPRPPTGAHNASVSFWISVKASAESYRIIYFDNHCTYAPYLTVSKCFARNPQLRY